MHRPALRCLLGLALVSSSGCGAIFKGETSTIQVLSDPAASDILVDGQSMGPGPRGVEVRSRDPHDVVLKAEGHRDQTFHVEPELHEGYLALDLLLLIPGIIPGVVALIVDGSTGSWYRSKPDDVAAVMVPEAPTADAPTEPAPETAPAAEPPPEPQPDDLPPAPPPLIPDEELPPPPPA